MSMPVTVHFLADLERILTSDPASPPLVHLSTNDPCLAWATWATRCNGVNGPIRNFSGILGTWYLIGRIVQWNPGDMVPDRPDRPAEPDPNPQSCDTNCSQH